MSENLSSTSSITIHAPAAKVWEALTNPEMVAKWLFGTKMETDWQVGSPVTYSGEWEGKAYVDKGTILEVVEPKLIKTTYWSGMSGAADIPENYYTITYTLVEDGENTTVSITQDGSKDEAGRDQSEGNWNMVLGEMKKLVEEQV